MWPYIAAGSAGGLLVTAAGIKHMFPWIKYDINVVRKMVTFVKNEKRIRDAGKTTADLFEDRVKEFPNKPFVIFEVKSHKNLLQFLLIFHWL